MDRRRPRCLGGGNLFAISHIIARRLLQEALKLKLDHVIVPMLHGTQGR